MSFFIPLLPSINEMIADAGKSIMLKGKTTAALRNEGKMMGTDWRNSTKGRALLPSFIYVGITRGDNKKRDVHNAYIKPFLDGLIDARLWPDDNEEWITSVIFDYVGIEIGKAQVEIAIYELDADLLKNYRV